MAIINQRGLRLYLGPEVKPLVCCIILLFVLFLLNTLPGSAQQATEEHFLDHRPLISNVWITFDLLMYKVSRQGGKTTYTPYFPEPLAKLNGKTVTISGYMIPIRAGRRHNVFLLSVLPIYQCMFCGQDGIPAMTEITIADGKKAAISEFPVTIRGVIKR